MVGEWFVGFVVIEESWNGMVEIVELVVDCQYWCQGIGQFLLVVVEVWVCSYGFGFMWFEMQVNNVVVCLIYVCVGFVFGGYDCFLYVDGENVGEVVLFWYKDLCDGQIV